MSAQVKRRSIEGWFIWLLWRLNLALSVLVIVLAGIVIDRWALEQKEMDKAAPYNELVERILGPGDMNDGGMALRLWSYIANNIKHNCSSRTNDPIKLLERGYGCCNEVANGLARLWAFSGLTARVCYMKFHTVPEAYYGGDWHMLDPDRDIYYLEWDDKTIASLREIGSDPALVRRVLDVDWNMSNYIAEKYAKYYANASCYLVDRQVLR